MRIHPAGYGFGDTRVMIQPFEWGEIREGTVSSLRKPRNGGNNMHSLCFYKINGFCCDILKFVKEI
jgi:hypothetical protein